MERIAFHAPLTMTPSRLVSNSGHVMGNMEDSLRK